MTSLSFFVAGEPKPQGSMKAFMVKGRPRITASNPKMDEWRQRVATEAQHAKDEYGWGYADNGEPISLTLDFALPRPKSIKDKDVPMVKRPDIDKLARAVLDALTGVLFADDSQANRVVMSKDYAKVGNTPGVHVVVEVGGGAL